MDGWMDGKIVCKNQRFYTTHMSSTGEATCI